MQEAYDFDVAVLGGGPGGYVAAIRAAQLGLKVALIEERQLGGTCLNRGCIPSKALISNAQLWKRVQEAHLYGIETGSLSFRYEQMAQRKDDVVDSIRKGLEGLIRSNAITTIQGRGTLLDAHTVQVQGPKTEKICARSLILATGSEPRNVAAFPFDHKRILDSTDLLALRNLPASLIVVGGGVIGCEFACLHAQLGVKVTILEALPQIIHTEGPQLGEALQKALEKQGIAIRTGVKVEGLRAGPKEVTATLAGGETIQAEIALVAVGRSFNTRGLGFEQAGVFVDERGVIPVNSRMQTNVPHVYAIGDITAQWLYAHWASYQGVIAAENCAGIDRQAHGTVCPGVIFTSPEVASVGLTLEKAREQGFDAVVSQFPFAHLGKAKASMETEGFAQVVTDRNSGLLLGAQCMGHEASIMIAEMTVAISNELLAASVSETVHAHPTLPEAWQEACLIAQNIPLHSPPKRSP
jgi:dihydrolipoamide dehydrogenase